MAGTNARAPDGGQRPVPGPLLAPAARRPAIMTAAACAVVVAALGALFWHQTGPSWLDRAIDARLHAIVAGHGHDVSLLTLPGGAQGVGAMTAALALGWLAARDWRGAVVTVVAVAAAEGITEGALKPLVHRTLAGNLSYPSGHATGTFALATVVMLLLAGPLRRLSRPVRALLTAAGYLIAAIVSVSMVGLGAHYFTDTIGGAAVAIGTVLTTALVAGRLIPPRRRPAVAPTAPPRRTDTDAGAATGPTERPAAGPTELTGAGPAGRRNGATADGRTGAWAAGRDPSLPRGAD